MARRFRRRGEGDNGSPLVGSLAVAGLSARLTRTLRNAARLGTRLSALEQEVQECRNTSKRLAEVMDVVVELLIAIHNSDSAAQERALTRYAAILEPARLKPDPSNGKAPS